MDKYIDGFVFPLKREHVEQYKLVADSVAEIYIEHGAIEYVEFLGDDMQRKCTRPFPDLVAASEDETVVFGWIVFESRESRDLVNKKVEADPRMPDLVAPLMVPKNQIFDATRMAYGGFSPMVRRSVASQ